MLPSAPATGVTAITDTSPAAARLRELRTALRQPGRTPDGSADPHFDEVLRLVNHERRVTVAWHRMGGPELFRLVLRTPPGQSLGLQATIGDTPVVVGAACFLDALERTGSQRLRDDVVRYRRLLLALPGRRLTDLADLEHLAGDGPAGFPGAG